MNCCPHPRMRLAGFNSKGRFYRCENCGKTDPEIESYEPELGQAVFGNPTSELDFDSMPDHREYARKPLPLGDGGMA